MPGQEQKFFSKKLEIIKTRISKTPASSTFLTREQIDRWNGKIRSTINGFDQQSGGRYWEAVGKEVRKHTKQTRLYLLFDAVAAGPTMVKVCEALVSDWAGNCNPYEYVDRDLLHDTKGVMQGAKKVNAIELALFMNKPKVETFKAVLETRRRWSPSDNRDFNAPCEAMILHLLSKVTISMDNQICDKLDAFLSDYSNGKIQITDSIMKFMIRRRQNTIIRMVIDKHNLLPMAIAHQNASDHLFATKQLYPSFEYAKIESEKLGHAPARSHPMERALKKVSCCSLVEKQQVRFKSPECAICLSDMVPGQRRTNKFTILVFTCYYSTLCETKVSNS